MVRVRGAWVRLGHSERERTVCLLAVGPVSSTVPAPGAPLSTKINACPGLWFRPARDPEGCRPPSSGMNLLPGAGHCRRLRGVRSNFPRSPAEETQAQRRGRSCLTLQAKTSIRGYFWVCRPGDLHFHELRWPLESRASPGLNSDRDRDCPGASDTKLGRTCASHSFPRTCFPRC